MHIIILISIFLSSLNAININLDIDKDFIKNIVIKINDKYYNPKTNKLTIKKDLKAPFDIFVYSKNIKPLSIKLLMKKKCYSISNTIFISHKSTIIDIIYSIISSKIDIDKNDIYSIKKSIKDKFKNEINTYLSFTLPNSVSIDDKLEEIFPLINKKINKFILTFLRKRLFLRNKTIYINGNNIDIFNSYLEIYNLNLKSIYKNGSFYNKIEDLNKINTIIIPNKTLVFKIFNKYSGELTLFNYLNTYENKLDKKNETQHILNFIFDESIILCQNHSSILSNIKFCHNFDLAENYISSKKQLFDILINNLPNYILKKSTFEKINYLRSFFYREINLIVRKNDSKN